MAESVAEKIPKSCISVHLCGYVSILLECKSTVCSGKCAFCRRKPPRSDSERFIVWWSRGESKPSVVVAALRDSVFVAEIVAESRLALFYHTRVYKNQCTVIMSMVRCERPGRQHRKFFYAMGYHRFHARWYFLSIYCLRRLRR